MTELTDYRPSTSLDRVVLSLSTEECEVAAALLDSIAFGGAGSEPVRAAACALSARFRAELDTSL